MPIKLESEVHQFITLGAQPSTSSFIRVIINNVWSDLGQCLNLKSRTI